MKSKNPKVIMSNVIESIGREGNAVCCTSEVFNFKQVQGVQMTHVVYYVQIILHLRTCYMTKKLILLLPSCLMDLYTLV